MKPSAMIVLGLTVALTVSPLRAIPTNFNQGFFNNAQGNAGRQPVEEWFRLPAHWNAGTVLPGTWSNAPGNAVRLEMEYPGAIFGITSRSVSVVKDKKGAILNVVATFDESTSKKSRAALLAALQKNIGVFAGSSARKFVDGSIGFTGAGLSINLATTGLVTVTLSRA